jgi:hypothetical protein
VNTAGVVTTELPTVENATATTKITQTPSLTIDKVTVYGEQSGDDLSGIIADTPIKWRYTVTNKGNIDLSNITVLDDSGTAKDPSDDFSAVYVSGDTNGDNKLDVDETWIFEALGTAVAGSYSNIGKADSNEADPATDESSYFGTSNGGQISPTGTTCEQYVGGTAQDFRDYYASQGGVIQYQVQKGVINNANPGVFFYYTGQSQTITGPGPVFIEQSDDNDKIGPFDPVNKDIKLWLVTRDGTCTQVKSTIDSTNVDKGDVTVTIGGDDLPTGSYYVISVKYDTGSVKGQPPAAKSGEPYETVKFTFTTNVGKHGSVEETDANGITLAPKSPGTLRERLR